MAHSMPLKVRAVGELTTLHVQTHGRVSSPYRHYPYYEKDRKTIQPKTRSLNRFHMEAPYEKVGRITHFYSKASVAVVELTAPLNKGDKIIIRGSTTNIEQLVDSVEIEHKQIANAQAGQSVGMKVSGHVRENDIVYRVKPSA